MSDKKRDSSPSGSFSGIGSPQDDPIQEQETKQDVGNHPTPENTHPCLKYRGNGIPCEECRIKNHELGDFCKDWRRLLKTFDNELKKKDSFMDKSDRDEIIQDTFLGIHKSLSSFKGNSKFTTWAYRIFSNKRSDFFWKKLKDKPNLIIPVFPDGLQNICTRYNEELYLKKSNFIGTLDIICKDPPSEVFEALRSLSETPSWQKTIDRLEKQKSAKIKMMPQRHPRSSSQSSKPQRDRENFDKICHKYAKIIRFKEALSGTLYAMKPMSDKIRDELSALSEEQSWKDAINDLYQKSRKFSYDEEVEPESVENISDPDAFQEDSLTDSIASKRFMQEGRKDLTLAVHLHKVYSDRTDLEKLGHIFEKLDPNCTALFHDFILFYKEDKSGYRSIVLRRAQIKKETLNETEIKKRCARLRKQFERCIEKLREIARKEGIRKG